MFPGECIPCANKLSSEHLRVLFGDAVTCLWLKNFFEWLNNGADLVNPINPSYYNSSLMWRLFIPNETSKAGSSHNRHAVLTCVKILQLKATAIITPCSLLIFGLFKCLAHV